MTPRGENLDYAFLCSMCNCPSTLTNYSRHLKTNKHKKNSILFLRDNPDFKESSYQNKIRNLIKFLALFSYKNYDLFKEIKYILITPVEDYSIAEYCKGFTKNITYENKFEISHFANGMY
jgi:hypothetical protein